MQDDASITLRSAVAGDGAIIHSMLGQLAETLGSTHKLVSDAQDIERHGFLDAPLFRALIAERGADAVGLCLYFVTFSTWLGAPGIYIQDLFVDESLRGAGLGQRLLARAAAEGRAMGANHLRLSVDSENMAARRFYSKVGLRCRDDEVIVQSDGKHFLRLAEQDGAA